ncbi:NADH-ubiquinone oxidoreductase-F iron-sulfur binding region domain-containing protein [soil metagenome]
MTLDELAKIILIERESQRQHANTIAVCTSAGCVPLKSMQLKEALETEVERCGPSGKCKVKGVGCLGLCSAGPMVSVQPDNVLYQKVSASDAPAIVQQLNGPSVERLKCDQDQPFFTRQTKIVLENCGRIDPERVEEYLLCDGYRALLSVLTQMTPAQVIEQVTRSGLRGRGGAGFPTGLKWTTVAKSASDGTGRKFVICNADEGDPGAFMDRSVLEGDPHRVLEGMAIAGFAVGAQYGYIYIRAEYPLATQRLRTAIRQAERLQILGSKIFGTTFNFHIEIRVGAGAYVCGEETALIASIEGNRGQPRPRPPYPAESGLWGCPTLINNVETFANVPPIIRKGGDWFASIGTERSKGTKVFALAGHVKNTGLIEVPMGMTLREIINEIGGGVSAGRTFKAVQTGGPSGGCIPKEHLDTPVEYESLVKLGSMMGSGGMTVMDDSSNMVDVARFFMDFCKSESCGKCVPCRVGTAQMLDLLQKLVDHKATESDLALLESLCDMVKSTSLCGLGQSAPNPTLATLRYFRDEYLQLLQHETNEIHLPVLPEVTL